MCDIYWQQATHVSQEVFNCRPAEQFISHFSGIHHIVEKDLFFKKFRAVVFIYPRFKDAFIPTYIVPHQLKHLLLENQGSRQIFIIKPVNLSRGRGIFLSRDPMSFSGTQSVVQLYV